MIDIKIVRENPALVRENIKKKFQDEKLPLVDEVLVLDEKWRKLKYDEDIFRSERNKISKKIADLMKSGNRDKAETLKIKAREIPIKIEATCENRHKLEKEIQQIMFKIPNIIHKSVPIGRDETDNVEIERYGEANVPDYKIFNHADLAEMLGGVDFDSARKNSGNGFYYLKGDIARLHSVILSYARDFMIEKGFELIVVPNLIRSHVVEGVMSFEEKDAMMYKIESEDLYLIGTCEHALIGMLKDRKFNGRDFPLTYTCGSVCYRKEVGSHGLDEKGFFRVHQFEKQEMIVACESSESYDWYERMLQYTVDFFRSLDIPVRKLECCSGDLADLKAKSADVEAWSPREQKYCEVGSCTNMEEAQARRLNIRYEKKGEIRFAHTLNNTVVATPRALRFLMENNQTQDGVIVIPKVLWPYMGGTKKIVPLEKKAEAFFSKV